MLFLYYKDIYWKKLHLMKSISIQSWNKKKLFWKELLQDDHAQGLLPGLSKYRQKLYQCRKEKVVQYHSSLFMVLKFMVKIPTNASQVCGRDGLAAILAPKRLACVAPEVNLMEHVM